MFGFFWWDWTMLIVLPAMIFSIIASASVRSSFAKYSQQMSRSGLTGAEAARRLLNAYGIYDVSITCIPGRDLRDHYDPRHRTLALSEGVYSSCSTAALGVACHEAGHAIQHACGYAPLKLRMAIIPVCNIGSQLAMPLFIIGLFLAEAPIGSTLMLLGIAAFSLATLFQLITLPVEFNASRRALAGMTEHRILQSTEELRGAKKVLSAAAMTYVAALAASLLSLLRLIVIAQSRRRD